MKRIQKASFALCIALSIIFTLCINAYASSGLSAGKITNSYFPQDYIGYRFPIYPGTDEWDALETHQDKVNACQIPSDVLANMTTEELIETVLAYPLRCDIFAYDNISVGYAVVSQHFNGLSELETRSDAVNELVNAYVEAEPANILRNESETTQARELSRSDDMMDTLTLSVILGQKTYREDMSQQHIATITELFADIVEGESIAVQDSNSTRAVTATPVQFYAYLRYGGTDSEVRTPEGNYVDAYYNSSCAEAWIYSDGQLYARNVYTEIPDEYISTINDHFEETYGITPSREPTVKYNCHSYAWHSTWSTNKYWLDYPSYFITDGSYEEVGKLEVEVGGRIVYYYSYDGTHTTPSHSAKVTAIRELPKSKRNFTVVSKWGMSGLYEHSWANCPYYYDTDSQQWPVDLKYFN